MREIKENLATMSVGEAIEQIQNAYIAIINKNLPINLMPSIMLWGAPGIGKSQGIRQLASELEKKTGKKVKITDVRLLLFNPVDLRGIPTSNADKTLAVWLKPKIFQMDEDNNIINILFLDEISAAPQSVQAAAYQITLDRMVGEHKLPDNCIIIAAGNRLKDRSVVVKMPKALANRLCHFDISSDFNSWKKWAIQNGINEKVLGFLTFRPDRLMSFNDEKDELAFATPRTWEMTSNILNYVSPNIDDSFKLIIGCLGLGMATEFRTWCKIYNKLPDIEEIFNGTCNTVPDTTDAIYALVASMVVYAKNNKEDMQQINNSIAYAQNLPPDFATVLFKDYMDIEEDYKSRLIIESHEFKQWLSKNAKYFIND